jgi:hypothetical protein
MIALRANSKGITITIPFRQPALSGGIITLVAKKSPINTRMPAQQPSAIHVSTTNIHVEPLLLVQLSGMTANGKSITITVPEVWLLVTSASITSVKVNNRVIIITVLQS